MVHHWNDFYLQCTLVIQCDHKIISTYSISKVVYFSSCCYKNPKFTNITFDGITFIFSCEKVVWLVKKFFTNISVLRFESEKVVFLKNVSYLFFCLSVICAVLPNAWTDFKFSTWAYFNHIPEHFLFFCNLQFV